MQARVLLVFLVAVVAAVGCGEEQVAVPDVEGQSVELAERELEAAGFQVTADVVEDEDYIPGFDGPPIVRGQQPQADDEAEEGSTVTLFAEARASE